MNPAFLFHVPFHLTDLVSGGERIKLKTDMSRPLILAGLFVEHLLKIPNGIG